MARLGPIIFPFTGYGVGGSHISTFLLAKSLRDDQGVPTLILAAEGSTVAKEAQARGLDVLTQPDTPASRRETLRDVHRFPARRRLLRSLGPDQIVHCCDIWSLQSWGVVAKSAGIPLVYHHRAFTRKHASDRLLIGLADEIISISEACSANLAETGAKPARSILNPFEDVPDPAAFADARNEFAERWPIEGLKLIGFSANFQRRKRARFFVEAAAAVAAQEPAARFVVLGRDRDETAAELGALAATLGIGDRIVFPGFRSPPERNIAALDLLAVPALAEPFGRTLVETMLLGVPYVATDDAGHGEIGRRWGGGALVDKAAPPDVFAATIVATLGRPDAALDAAARARVAHELTPSTHAANVLRTYRELRA